MPIHRSTAVHYSLRPDPFSTEKPARLLLLLSQRGQRAALRRTNGHGIAVGETRKYGSCHKKGQCGDCHQDLFHGSFSFAKEFAP
jgi:hypothetical protein